MGIVQRTKSPSPQTLRKPGVSKLKRSVRIEKQRSWGFRLKALGKKAVNVVGAAVLSGFSALGYEHNELEFLRTQAYRLEAQLRATKMREAQMQELQTKKTSKLQREEQDQQEEEAAVEADVDEASGDNVDDDEESEDDDEDDFQDTECPPTVEMPHRTRAPLHPGNNSSGGASSSANASGGVELDTIEEENEVTFKTCETAPSSAFVSNAAHSAQCTMAVAVRPSASAAVPPEQRRAATGLFAQINAGGFTLRKNKEAVLSSTKTPAGARSGNKRGQGSGNGSSSGSKRARRSASKATAPAPSAKAGFCAQGLLAARRNLRKSSARPKPPPTSEAKGGTFFERALRQKFKQAFPAKAAETASDSPTTTPGKWD